MGLLWGWGNGGVQTLAQRKCSANTSWPCSHCFHCYQFTPCPGTLTFVNIVSSSVEWG